jgi:hypothetical protein
MASTLVTLLLAAPFTASGLSEEKDYIVADWDRFNMNITIGERDLGDHYHLKIRFTVPTQETAEKFDLILIYGLQIVGGKRSDLPSDTYPTLHGNWNIGDRVTLEVDIPKQFSDAGKGWNLTFCVGSDQGCWSSPNLLKRTAMTPNVAESLGRIKAALENYSNLRGSIERANRYQFSNTYRITAIDNCAITVTHKSTSFDHNYDGVESTSTSIVDLRNLDSAVKLSIRDYGAESKPARRSVLTANIVHGGSPIVTDKFIDRMPGTRGTERSQADKIEIEFADEDVAEVIGKMFGEEIIACHETGPHRSN